MKIYIFYRPQTAADLSIDYWLKAMNPSHRPLVELIDINTRAGDDLSRVYQLMSYPSVMITTDSGQQVKLWHGELPPSAELSSYLH